MSLIINVWGVYPSTVSSIVTFMIAHILPCMLNVRSDSLTRFRAYVELRGRLFVVETNIQDSRQCYQTWWIKCSSHAVENLKNMCLFLSPSKISNVLIMQMGKKNNFPMRRVDNIQARTMNSWPPCWFFIFKVCKAMQKKRKSCVPLLAELKKLLMMDVVQLSVCHLIWMCRTWWQQKIVTHAVVNIDAGTMENKQHVLLLVEIIQSDAVDMVMKKKACATCWKTSLCRANRFSKVNSPSPLSMSFTGSRAGRAWWRKNGE